MPNANMSSMKLCGEGFSVACYFPKFRFLSIRRKKDVSKKQREGFSDLITLRNLNCEVNGVNLGTLPQSSALTPFSNLVNVFQLQIFKSPFFKELHLSYGNYQPRFF